MGRRSEHRTLCGHNSVEHIRRPDIAPLEPIRTFTRIWLLSTEKDLVARLLCQTCARSTCVH